MIGFCVLMLVYSLQCGPIYKDQLTIILVEALKEKSLKSKRLSYHPFNRSIICPFSKLEYTLYKEFHPSHFIILLQISHVSCLNRLP